MKYKANHFLKLVILLTFFLLHGCSEGKNIETTEKPVVTSTPKSDIAVSTNNKISEESDITITINNNNFNLNKSFDDSMLKNLNTQELMILTNSIYAKYGYKFKLKEFSDYFSKISWYKPQFDDVSSYLNVTDNKNISAIKKYKDFLSIKDIAIKYSEENEDYTIGGKVNIKLKDNKEEILYITKEEIKSTTGDTNCPVRIKLKINNKETVFESLWNDGVHVSVADFDNTDNVIDIYITVAGTDIGTTTFIYKYDGNKIYKYDSFNHSAGIFCYDEKGKIYYWSYKYGEDDKREFNHFYDYKTKKTGKITDAKLKTKLNEKGFD